MLNSEPIKIIIPSHLRAENVTTKIDNMILVVEENQIDKYKEYNDCEIIAHPKLKNLAQKRNWIINHFENAFMVDDDVINFVRVNGTLARNERNLNSQETYEIIQKSYSMANQLNCFLFGFGSSPVPIQYNGLKPIKLNGSMCGGAYGIIQGGNLKFNEETTACDSHYISLRNMLINRKSFIDNRYSIEFQSTFKTSGGQSDKRTLCSEKRDTLYLRKQFGEVVKLRQSSANKKNHEYQRTISYDF